MKAEMTFEQILEVEDYLQGYQVFINGLSKNSCHSDSYGTIVEFARLDSAIEQSLFPKEQIEFCIDYWNENPNVGPTLKLVAAIWNEKL